MKDYDPIQWWYTGWKICGAVVKVAGPAMPTVFLGWDTMLMSGKLVAAGGLFVSAWGAVDLLFDQTMRRISEGKTPVQIPGGNGGSGDTQIIKKPEPGK